MTEPIDPNIDDAVLRAAWLYYRDDLTQDQIAKVLKVSRATVGRLLERARKEGVVRVELDPDLLGAIGLAGELDERFSGAEVLVVPSDGIEHDQDEINGRVAQAAAQLLRARMAPGDTLAIGWGDTVAKTLTQLAAADASGEVVSLTGGVSSYLDPAAESYRNRLTMIPAPFLASTAELADAISAEAAVKRCMERATAAPWKLVGIGSLDSTASLVRLGYQTPEDLAALAEGGAVGDIIGQFFDADGRILDVEVHDRRIGVDLADLDAAPGRTIAIAGG
ncbi:MAG: sugar-binding domain-containing protein, partial [Chloroflexota bacterium]|nr:sugar-binding domain-containing protein [Chloroflexota bacterium]